MALLDGKTQSAYYQGSDYGGYQFVTLQDIISQFMTVYVGEEKLVNKASRTDVAFHAQRALAELSFDTLKSFKSQSIVLPPTLVMTLPHDYVNYTRVLWCDEAGIKRPLYRTNDTQNPFQIKQKANGAYDFSGNTPMIFNDSLKTITQAQFEDSWTIGGGYERLVGDAGYNFWENTASNSVGVITEVLNTGLTFRVHQLQSVGNKYGAAPAVYQSITANTGLAKLKAKAITQAASVVTVNDGTNGQPDFTGLGEGGNEFTGPFTKPATTVRVGVTTRIPDNNELLNPNARTTNDSTDLFDVFGTDGTTMFLEWTNGEAEEEKELEYDLTSYGDQPLYLVAVAIVPWAEGDAGDSSIVLFQEPKLTEVSIVNGFPTTDLEPETGYYRSSIMWEKYKSHVPNENNNDDYANDDYQRVMDERYGLDPSRAQTNGSFYIDDLYGRIHFSSNVSGKTVILDYISDSLGTEDEMQVHKFAEDAMYKWITYGVLSSKINIPEYIVQRARKEKIAATRKAKLRLSSIKLEEITQILRGKSKHIKH